MHGVTTVPTEAEVMERTKITRVTFPYHGNTALVHGIAIDLSRGVRATQIGQQTRYEGITYQYTDAYNGICIRKISRDLVFRSIE